MMSPFELATLSVVIFRSISPNLVSSEQGSYVDCTLSSKHYIYPAWQEARKHYQNSEAALAMEESDKEDPCAEEKISRCYASYLEALTSTLFLPEDEKLLKAMEGADEVRACSRLKEKLPCHKRIERCPKNITEQFSRQQESYRYIEDVVCDGSVRNGRTRRYISAIVASCVDFKELLKCKVGKLQEWKQGEESYISKSFLCKTTKLAYLHRRYLGHTTYFTHMVNQRCNVMLCSISTFLLYRTVTRGQFLSISRVRIVP
ncbi:uncharacterized protein LOC144105311 isoform X2 [Amblyomma americanum]